MLWNGRHQPNVYTNCPRPQSEQVPIIGYMHAPRSIQMNSCLLFSILCFYFTHSIILITSMSLHFSLYFPLFYFPLFAHLFTTWHFTFASTSRLHMCTNILVGADSLATRQAFASTRRDSFASAIPTHLHPLDAGLSKTFPRIMGRVKTRAAYDLIGKSWPGARYMRGEPRNTLSLSSVLGHH